jgi:hypothetical protein
VNIRSLLRAVEEESFSGRLAGPLAEAGWEPRLHTMEYGAQIMVGVAGYNRYWLYPPMSFAAHPNLCALSDRVCETGVFVESAILPTPRQAAKILREHGIPSLEMTSEQSRRGQPRVVLPRGGTS